MSSIIILSFLAIALSTCEVVHFLHYACWNAEMIIVFYLNYLALFRSDDSYLLLRLEPCLMLFESCRFFYFCSSCRDLFILGGIRLPQEPRILSGYRLLLCPRGGRRKDSLRSCRITYQRSFGCLH